MDGLEFLPEVHRYRYKDPATQRLRYATASITTVCNTKTKEQMDKIMETKHIWEPRGNTVHHCMELFSIGKSCDPGEYREWVEPLVNHDIWKRWTPIANELRMVDTRYGIAGSCDVIIQHNETGEQVLADFKTQSRKDSTAYDIKPQLGGYLSLIDQCYGKHLNISRCFGIWSRPGDVEITVYNSEDCITAYLAARDIYLRNRPDW